MIIPSYNEEENIEHTSRVIGEILKKNNITYELIFVDDGSKDSTFSKIEEAKEADSAVKAISFSRNFGKEACIFAGLHKAQGKCAVVIDCDLQHPPELIPKMFDLWKHGYEVVEGVKSSRGKEKLLYRAFSGLFYSVLSRSTKMDMQASSDFKLLDRKVIDVFNQLPERAAFFRALSFWVGFKTTTIEYDVQDRKYGKTKWSTGRLIQYAVSNILSFASFPLQLVTSLGFVLIVASIILGIQTLVKYFSGTAVEGFTTVILLLLIIGGAVMVSLGIIGYYLSKIYDEVKGRPRYIISKEIN